jgi:hypothetical protein
MSSEKMPKAKKKPAKKAAKKAVSALSLLNLKVSKADRDALNAQAKKYAKGNLSAWLRFAGTQFKPKKSQLSATV